MISVGSIDIGWYRGGLVSDAARDLRLALHHAQHSRRGHLGGVWSVLRKSGRAGEGVASIFYDLEGAGKGWMVLRKGGVCRTQDVRLLWKELCTGGCVARRITPSTRAADTCGKVTCRLRLGYGWVTGYARAGCVGHTRASCCWLKRFMASPSVSGKVSCPV